MIVGGLIVVIGIFVSVFVNFLGFFSFIYGFIVGFGIFFLYLVFFVVVMMYFEKRCFLVMGLVECGVGIGMLIFVFFM